MPTDAKLGLIVGVVLVLAVAVLFFPKEPGATPNPAPATAVDANAPPSAAALLPAPMPIAKPKNHEIRGQTASRPQDKERTAQIRKD